jgi:hypothetical protein
MRRPPFVTTFHEQEPCRPMNRGTRRESVRRGHWRKAGHILRTNHAGLRRFLSRRTMRPAIAAALQPGRLRRAARRASSSRPREASYITAPFILAWSARSPCSRLSRGSRPNRQFRRTKSLAGVLTIFADLRRIQRRWRLRGGGSASPDIPDAWRRSLAHRRRCEAGAS